MSSKKSKNLRVSMHGESTNTNAIHYHPHQYLLNGKHELINAKSQYDAEFRRFAIDTSVLNSEHEFRNLLTRLHNLKDNDFYITYIDKSDGDFLPINNDDNYAQALRSYAPPSVLRIIIKRKDQDGGATIFQANRNGEHQSTSTHRTAFKLLSRDQNNSNGSHSNNVRRRNNQIQIGQPQNFRPVSSIIDADILPETLRRVKMMKHNNERPLGFYIRDGVCVRPTSNGIEKVPGIYISRVVPGGLAESTGLLNVDDEVLEVNGIDVEGKTLDQVTDMMIANSSNLILTIKPANQGHISWSGGAAAGGTMMGDRSSSSKLSRGSAHSATSSSRSSGTSGSLPRHRGVKNNENLTTKSSKLPSSLLAGVRNGQQQPQAAAANTNGDSSWRDSKFRTSQTSQGSSASSSSMSIGGAAGGGSNQHSPFDADDMDEVREYPANTAAAYELLLRQQQQQQQRNSGLYTSETVPTLLQRPEHRRESNNVRAANAVDAGFINPGFGSHRQTVDSDALAAAASSSNGTRTNQSKNGTARHLAAEHAHSASSSRSSAMDMF